MSKDDKFIFNSKFKDKFDRFHWDDIFMALCFVISQRSIDPNTKHGCVIVSDNRTILSMGYNGPPRGCDDSKIQLERPLKYKYLKHSEAASIINAANVGVSLNGSIAYITGHPCEDCFGDMISVGIKKIIYGHVGSSCVNEETLRIINNINSKNNIEIIEYKNIDALFDIFKSVMKYMEFKNDL